jgi:peptidyl-prolyl cis-trans isomerase B (cyclophilin B)
VLSYGAMRRALGPLLAALALVGCGSSASHSATGAAAASASATSSTTPTASGAAGACRVVARPPARPVPSLKAPTVKLDPHRAYTVTVVTNCGTFAFRLDVKDSPKTSASFYSLVQRGFFDGLTFHRVVPGFVIQGGDPTGTGLGGPGYTVVEAPPRHLQYVQGVVAMAKTQAQPAGASGSQFFIVTGANAELPPDYALLGRVVSGQSIVDAIGSLPTNANQMPSPRVVMSKVAVAEH